MAGQPHFDPHAAAVSLPKDSSILLNAQQNFREAGTWYTV